MTLGRWPPSSCIKRGGHFYGIKMISCESSFLGACSDLFGYQAASTIRQRRESQQDFAGNTNEVKWQQTNSTKIVQKKKINKIKQNILTQTNVHL